MFINVNLEESKTLLTVLLRRENVSAAKARKQKYMKALTWQVLRLTPLVLFSFFLDAFCFAVVVEDNFSPLFLNPPRD